jgi:branched-chain amino acid transport system permease protein
VHLYFQAAVSGIAVGGIYALVAVAITQTYKVTRVLNFALAGFLVWGAYLYSVFTYDVHWPVALAALSSVAIVGLMGASAQILVFRFARKAAAANKIIITFALLQLLGALTTQLFGNNPRGAANLFPSGGIKTFGIQVAWSQLADLGIALAAAGLLTIFLKWTRTGLMTRALAEDPTMMSVLGARKGRIDLLNWTFCAVLAGAAGVMIAPETPFLAGDFFVVFIIALVGSLFGHFHSLPRAALGGIGVSVLYSLAAVKFNDVGSGDLLVFIVGAAVVLLTRRWPQDITKLAWSRTTGVRAVSRQWLIQRVLFVGGGSALVVAAFTSLVWAQTATLILINALAALSLVPLIGWTGQLSLAQAGFMGIGAYIFADAVTYYSIPYPLGVVIGVVGGGLAGCLVGILCRRVPFALGAVLTLAFTDACGWLFNNDGLFHTVNGTALVILPPYLSSSLDQLTAVAVVFVLAVGVLWAINRSVWGLRFAAVKGAPVMAEHFGIRTSWARVYAYVISGAIAGAAGVAYSAVLQGVSPQYFTAGTSLQVMLFAVAGGVTALYGCLLSTGAFLGAPQLIGLAKYGQLAWPNMLGGAGTIGLFATYSDGLVSTVRRPRPAAKKPVSVAEGVEPVASLVPDVVVASGPREMMGDSAAPAALQTD